MSHYSEMRPTFAPKDLIRCTRVCRMWYNVFMPLVWHYYDAVSMNKIPRHVVHKYASLIRVLNSRQFHHGVDFRCENLVQMSVSPWMAELERLIRENTKLQVFRWNSQFHYPSVRASVYEAMAASMKRLRVLEFTGCDLDPKQLFPLLETHLPKLRVLILHQVNILHADNMTEDDFELGRTRRPCFRKIREIRMGKGIMQSGHRLVDLVKFCPNLERLVLEELDKQWTLNRTHGLTESNNILDALMTNIARFCPKLKSVEYRPNLFVSGGAPMLQDGNYARLVACIDSQPSTASTSPNNSHDDGEDDDDQPPIVHSFAADMPALESRTTLALCTMDITLQSVHFRLHESKNEVTTRANLMNAHQILTSCRALKHFTLEYYNVHNFDTITSTSTAGMLFDNPWACAGLESFSINGIKRSVSINDIAEDRQKTWNTIGMPPVLVKLHELKTLAGLAKTPYILSAIQCGHRRSRLKDLDELQARMFGQLARLKNMQLLTFNGETFRDFSKLSRQ
ncbi:hypothetical protein BGX31_009150 [Mortierella sp. GBA43]|nr:hypothetical protein BGX31_009150 [Mortierella sp. GBA43]